MSLSAYACAETLISSPMVTAENFQEDFDEYPQTSTESITSVRLGDVSGAFDNHGFRIATPPTELLDTQILCVQTTTQDARFLAENPYSGYLQDEEAALLIAPITHAYKSQLHEYNQNDIALRAVAGLNASCLESGNVFLPQIGGGNIAELTVLINTRDQDAEIFVRNSEKEVLTALCRYAGNGPRMAYDQACTVTIPLTWMSGIVDVKVLLEDGLSDPATIDFSFFLPSKDTLQ